MNLSSIGSGPARTRLPAARLWFGWQLPSSYQWRRRYDPVGLLIVVRSSHFVLTVFDIRSVDRIAFLPVPKLSASADKADNRTLPNVVFALHAHTEGPVGRGTGFAFWSVRSCRKPMQYKHY